MPDPLTFRRPIDKPAEAQRAREHQRRMARRKYRLSVSLAANAGEFGSQRILRLLSEKEDGNGYG